MPPKIQRHEYDCKCGCGKNNVKQEVIDRTLIARDLAGVAFNITSGCRCETHNANEGGSDTSSHLPGEAEDIECDNSRNRFKMIKALIEAGFNRIGIGKGFIHADIDRSKAPAVVWLY